MHRRDLIKSCAGLALGSRYLDGHVPLFYGISPFQELSRDFSMTIDGIPVPVNYAAGSYSYANVEVGKPVEIVITALHAGFWKNGVEMLPSRHGLRPILKGDEIKFILPSPEKLAISRPGDFYFNAPILFLFGNGAGSAPPAAGRNIRYYPPGVYHENLTVKSNETVYLDQGAVIYGSLNFWDVNNAQVFGGGVIIHDGPQNPETDEGWQHRPNWHGITAHNADSITIKEITVIVRSRTWMIQLQGCKNLLFENLKVIGGTRGNANQDGIDWLGCGDTIVRNCFFRCSDDIFAIYGNTGFYDDTVAIPGLDVENILIENCVLSTSISNVMRVGWPRKVFNSRNVSMRNCDIVHAGQGGCVVPFALAEFWADPDGKGLHRDYLFEDIRMDTVYSITQILQSKNGSGSVKNIRFKNIRLSGPPLVDSAIGGECSEISFENLKFADFRVDRLSILGIADLNTAARVVQNDGPKADFHYDSEFLKVGQPITFDARSSTAADLIKTYKWNFGDGNAAEGASVTHVFKDNYGSRFDGTGQFRVQLTVTDKNGVTDAIVKSLVIGGSLASTSELNVKQQGLSYRYFPGVDASWNALQGTSPPKSGDTRSITEAAISCPVPYTLWFDGFIDVAVPGGYTFYISSRDGAWLQLNNAVLINSNARKAQVCGTVGNVVQQFSAVYGFEAGFHAISFGYKQDLGTNPFSIWWQGPRTCLERVPMNRFFSRL